MRESSPLDGGGSVDRGPRLVKHRAAITARAQIVLPVAVGEAWDRLLDWESQPQWMRDADRVDVLTPRRAGTGVVIAVKTRVLNVPLLTERLEVVAWEPPRRVRLAHTGLVGGYGEWRLTPVTRGAERGTRLTWEERLSLGVPLVGTAALAAYRPFLELLMRGSLRNLRTMLSSPRASSSTP
jgi:hypothetical protein